MKKFSCFLTFMFAFLFFIDGFAQSVIIGPGQYTGYTYGPMRTYTTANQKARFAYIYPASLLTGLNPGDTIRSVEFERTGTNAMVGNVNFKIYLGTTSRPDWGTTALGWDTTITSYTLVYDDNPTAVLGASAGFKKFDLNAPFIYNTTNGTNLVVLCEYSSDLGQTTTINWYYDASAGVPAYASNQTKYSSGTTLPANLSSSNERHPVIKINFPKQNDAAVSEIYTYGKMPVPFGNPHVIKAIVTNAGLSSLTNVNVTLNITGSNTFTDLQTIASLAPEASVLVTFAAYNPANAGDNVVEVTVPNDDAVINNSMNKALLTNYNTFSFNQGTVAAGGAGFNGATGDFVAKFTIASQQTLNLVDLVFTGSGQPFQIGIWDATGTGGAPGVNIYLSDTLTSQTGVVNVNLPNVVIPAGNFYMGVRQLGTTNVAFAFQNEAPLRSETFYYTSPAGSASWTDFAPGLTFRLMIDPKFALQDDAAVLTMTPSGEVFYPAATTEIDMAGSVLNYGLNNATFTVTRKIFDGASTVYTNTQNVTSLAPSDTQDVVFLPFSGFASGTEYTIKDSISLTGDDNPLNDVMTVSFTPKYAKPLLFVYGNTTNERANRDSVIAALNLIGAVYDTLNRDNGLVDFTPWSTLIWSEDVSLTVAERSALISFLNAGTELNEKSLFIAGDDIGFQHGRSASTNYDTTFYWGYLHAQYFLDDGNGTPDKGIICGVNIAPGACDSINSIYPDGIGTMYGSVKAYRFAELPVESDTVIGVAYDGEIYNVAYLAFEFKEIMVPIIPDGPEQIVEGVLSWIVDAGGTIPVELVAFSVNVNENNVTLNWSTATETNNNGFAVERKTDGKSFEQVAFIKGHGTTTEKINYSYTDANLGSGKYVYRLKQIDNDGTITYSNEVNVDIAVPKEYALEQNYPNPFNPVTKIKYAVPVDGFVNLAIYNALGERVSTLVQGVVKPGIYEVDFNAASLASGVYFYRLEAGNFVSIKKMMLLK